MIFHIYWKRLPKPKLKVLSNDDHYCITGLTPFTLNALLTFLLNSPINIDGDKKITINDFFLLESLRYDSLIKNDKVTLSDLLKTTNPIEYLQG